MPQLHLGPCFDGERGDIFRPRQSSLEAHLPWLDAQWDAGARNASALWRSLRTSGFQGSLRVVLEWATRRRRAEPSFSMERNLAVHLLWRGLPPDHVRYMHDQLGVSDAASLKQARAYEPEFNMWLPEWREAVDGVIQILC